ncbi:MAG: hypothetical protein ACI88A_000493 [Paraglaciecola sp.]|jgi:hypothetical protein
MKTIIFIGLVLVTALFLYQQNDKYIPAEDNALPADIPQSIIDKPPQTRQDQKLENTVTIKTELDLNIKQQIAETKTELDSLMLEYNDNLKNLEKRKLLETKITLLLDQYNQLVLPEALEKVRGGDNPPS